jgi:hypothetical protein
MQGGTLHVTCLEELVEWLEEEADVEGNGVGVVWSHLGQLSWGCPGFHSMRGHW